MKRLLKLFKWMSIAAVVVFVTLILFVVFVVAPRIKSKEEMVHNLSLVQYRELLIDVGPEAQFENDTCGLHTLRVIYKAYGLNPDGENLRKRLGLDTPANPFDKNSTGTLQPDMLRVLHQDGFGYELLETGEEGASKKPLKHLEEGNMAAILISRRENGNMHWVAAKKVDEGRVVVLDSLFDEAYVEEPGEFFRAVVLSCVLLSPSAATGDDNSLVYGSRDLLNTTKRYREVRKYRAEQDAELKSDPRGG